jgi:hypothetical protein
MPSRKHRRLAGIVAAAGVTAACAASPPAASPPALRAFPAHDVVCTTLPTARAPVGGTTGQRSPLDMLAVPGGLLDVAARSASSTLAIGVTAPPQYSRLLVAQWNGAVWTTLNDPALPRLSSLGAVAVYPGGGWAVGEYGLTDHGDGGGIARHLIVRVTGSTVRRVSVPGPAYGTLLDVAATSATDAWAVGSIFRYVPLILHWNGTTWTRAHLPATIGRGAFDSVAATSATNAWAVLSPQHGRRSRIVHWNGQRWGDVVGSPAIDKGYGIASLSATSSTNMWALGAAGAILHWNGHRWTCAITKDNLSAVSTSSADNAWAVGSSGYGPWAVAWHWNGHNWKQVTFPAGGPDQPFLQGVAAIPQTGRAWAVGGTDAKTLMLHWDGRAWH